MSEDQWFVILRGRKKGPFTVSMLMQIKEITPDTLAWKEGMLNWMPIRTIPELQLLFEEPEEPTPLVEEVEKGMNGEGVALTLPNAEPPLMFWFFFAFIVILYAIYLIYHAV